MCFSVKNITHGTSEYEEVVKLRYRLLREPLGLSFSEEELAAENTFIHFACYKGKILVGCLALQPDKKEGILKMRQVAVDDAFRGKGAGRMLVDECEKKAKEKGYKQIILHARNNAIKFYEKMGYVQFGEEFYEVGLPHYKMKKSL